jgi:CubicO group peptidase (beta-lactamase class C family)
VSAGLQSLLDEGVKAGAFPSAQAVVLHRGACAFSGTAGPVSADTAFDLASLTKVMCTTALFLRGWGQGRLGPSTPLARLFPGTPAAEAGVTLADLLYHRSGLPAWLPYFARVMPAVPELFDPATPRATWEEVRSEVRKAVVACGLRRPRGAEAVYSDVGFLQLGFALEELLGAPLDALFAEHVAGPLGLAASFRRITARLPGEGIPQTGNTRPREPAPGQETMWTPFPVRPSSPGEVDDDNAWVLDGVAGHAGLFASASDVARFGQAVLEEFDGAGRLAPAPLWSLALAQDLQVPGSSRALGFDTPAPPASAGTFIGNVPPGAVGHTGFTGTSLWVDVGRQLVIALTTNRTAHGRHNLALREFRPRFHDAAVRALSLESPSP